MKWFDWKFWRFAWSEKIEPYRNYGTDDDGEWVRIIGPLFWLRRPR